MAPHPVPSAQCPTQRTVPASCKALPGRAGVRVQARASSALRSASPGEGVPLRGDRVEFQWEGDYFSGD